MTNRRLREFLFVTRHSSFEWRDDANALAGSSLRGSDLEPKAEFYHSGSVALALGIGPNTAIFSVVYATLLAPLPFPEPDQLVMVWSKTRSGVRNSVSSGDYLAWKESATSFACYVPARRASTVDPMIALRLE